MTTDKLTQPRLDALGAYPFERLKALLGTREPSVELAPIDAGAGEPRLPLPSFTEATLLKHIDGFSRYPSTRGSDFLRQAIANWLMRRYGLPEIDAAAQVLSANGTRESLFAIAHALVNPEAAEKPYVLMPNPMYQIYYGAAVTAGADPFLLNCAPENGFEPALDRVPESVWRRTAFIYVCSPGNPTGWVADHDYYRRLLELADRYDFHIVADECYSEIYCSEAPVGLLQVAHELDRSDFARCLVMNSLSKRSALPGMRSGFIAGDAALIERFAKLRSYTGPATPLPLQHVAAAAWSDEAHVQTHLDIYQRSITAFFDHWQKSEAPAGSFFVWLPVADDEAFAMAAWEQQGVVVLPGSYLGATDSEGHNPGKGYVRAALIDGPEKAAELAQRLKEVTC